VKIQILVGALVLSLGLNIWQMWQNKLLNNNFAASRSDASQLPLLSAEPIVRDEFKAQVASANTFAPPNYPQQAAQNNVLEGERQTLLKQASTWLDDGEWAELRLFLQDYLQTHPQDWDFVLLEAKLNVQTELLSDAIANYYSLRKLPLSHQQQQEVEEQLLVLTNQTINQLQLAYSWDTLAIFVEPLLQYEPQNRSFIVALAEAYARQQQTNLMENILASLAFDDPDALRIRAIEQQGNAHGEQTAANQQSDLRPQESSYDRVKLQRLGDHFIVKAQLGNNDAQLLIDTGASITAITYGYYQRVSRRSFTRFLGRFSVSTANGPVLAPMYQVAELRLNQSVVANSTVVLLNMPEQSGIDGLLGMNFLREFDFRINQSNAELLLRKR
jgi:clan AA aspartic protease (TIGR02281 family)